MSGEQKGEKIREYTPRQRFFIHMAVGAVIGLFACFLLLLFSRTGGLVLAGLMGTGLFMATIYPSAFAFGSDCIRGNDFGCSILILTGSIGGVITPALVGFAAERAGIRAGMTLVAVFTGLLLVSILLSYGSYKIDSKKGRV